MVRAVLVGGLDGVWTLYRQPAWMAEVRRDPAASRRPRRHFDLEDGAFAAVLLAWAGEAAGSSEEAAVGLLASHGAVEVARPG